MGKVVIALKIAHRHLRLEGKIRWRTNYFHGRLLKFRGHGPGKGGKRGPPPPSEETESVWTAIDTKDPSC
jgi:hypothetical protein